ncbi:MAG: glutathionylspermidine synthase family protein [Planctomycetota bacterium]
MSDASTGPLAPASLAGKPADAALSLMAASHAQMRSFTWPISASEFREVLRALSIEYCKWDMHLGGVCRILPESIVLSRKTHKYLRGIAEAFAALMRRFETHARRDAALIEWLGIDPRLAPLLAAESEHELSFGRADFFLTPEGRWVLSEFNEDVPGGFNEAMGVAETVGVSRLGGCQTGDLRSSLVRAFADCRRVGLVFATAFSEDLQHCALLEKWLSQAGFETVLASPEHLHYARRRACLSSAPVDGIFRFYPGEWLVLLPNLADWARALPQLRMMSPPVRLLSQSKKSFGAWQARGLLDGADRVLVERFCPRTEPFVADQIAFYRQAREHLVLKRVFGRMGDAVQMGALSSPQEWESAITYASSHSREFTMQERFLVQPLAFAAGTMYPTVGVYIVNGRFAGYYSRVAPEPFITHEAYYVATVVEAA